MQGQGRARAHQGSGAGQGRMSWRPTGWARQCTQQLMRPGLSWPWVARAELSRAAAHSQGQGKAAARARARVRGSSRRLRWVVCGVVNLRIDHQPALLLPFERVVQSVIGVGSCRPTHPVLVAEVHCTVLCGGSSSHPGSRNGQRQQCVSNPQSWGAHRMYIQAELLLLKHTSIHTQVGRHAHA